MAASSMPFTSAGVDGCTTLRPGTWASQASSDCECWAAAPVPEPAGKRMTSGTFTLPPSMKRSLAAWLTICSMASVAKSENWNSSTGLQPASAAPTATPAWPSSEIGASITRSSP